MYVADRPLASVPELNPTALVQCAEVVKKSAQELRPQAESEDFAQSLRPVPAEPAVFYQNYFVGECRDLLFGVSLSDYHAMHPDFLIPLIVTKW